MNWMKLASHRRLIIPSTHVFDAIVKEGTSNEVVLLLHGYAESGERMLKKLSSALPKDASIVAANGIYPIPRKVENSYRLGFAWYFYNPFTDEYFIDMSIASDVLKQALKSYGFENHSKTIIGFSQGGYLAPFAAQNLTNVKQVIGIGCQFLDQELTITPSFQMHEIHGEKDDVIEIANSKRSHDNLVQRGVSGTFVTLPNTDHSIDEAVVKSVADLFHLHR